MGVGAAAPAGAPGAGGTQSTHPPAGLHTLCGTARTHVPRQEAGGSVRAGLAGAAPRLRRRRALARAAPAAPLSPPAREAHAIPLAPAAPPRARSQPPDQAAAPRCGPSRTADGWSCLHSGRARPCSRPVPWAMNRWGDGSGVWWRAADGALTQGQTPQSPASQLPCCSCRHRLPLPPPRKDFDKQPTSPPPPLHPTLLHPIPHPPTPQNPTHRPQPHTYLLPTRPMPRPDPLL